MSSVNFAALLAVVPEWSITLSLIFAGCCSNAFYLEQATRIQPACGTLLTFLQFLFTSLHMLPTQLRFRDEKTGKAYRCPRFRFPKVPLARWSVQVAMYFGTTILNNSAFSFHVPVPVHIIFRSGGLVVSMLAGYWIKGSRYSLLQIVSVICVTVGVIISTLATTPDAGDMSAQGSGPSATTYFAGISLLVAALFLSSLMGLYQEQTYGSYGKEHWQEGLFYNHFLSLPLFALRAGTLQSEWQMALADKQMWVGWGSPSNADKTAAVQHNLFRAWSTSTNPSTMDMLRQKPEAVYDVRQLLYTALPVSVVPRSPIWSGPSLGILVPILIPALAMNVITQLVCVNGVNRLTAMCSSLTVTLVLVVRKAVSLAISVLIVAPSMGEEVRGKSMLFFGATCVLLGTLGYALGSTSATTSQQKDAKASADGKKATADAETDKRARGTSTAIESRSNGKVAHR